MFSINAKTINRGRKFSKGYVRTPIDKLIKSNTKYKPYMIQLYNYYPRGKTLLLSIF